MGKSKRNSNFEILRLISIFLIVAHHFAVHSGLSVSGAGQANQLVYAFFRFGGKLGVDCFILISGYFLVKDTCLNFARFLRLECKMLVYSLVIYAACVLSGEAGYTPEGLRQAFFPLTSNVWWFMTVYMALYLFHPFLNLALKRMKKPAYLVLLGIMFVLWLFIPQINGLGGLFGYNDLLFFVFLYCAAGYFSLHGLPKISRCLYAIAALLSFAFVVTYWVMVFNHTEKFSGLYHYFGNDAGYFFDMQKIPLVLCSVSVFLLFGSMKPHCNRIVNLAASTTLGIYLIHDHAMMRAIIWKKWFHGAKMINSPLLFLYGLGAILAVFIVSALADLLYTYAIEYPIGKLLKMLPPRWRKKLIVQIEPTEAEEKRPAELAETTEKRADETPPAEEPRDKEI